MLQGRSIGRPDGFFGFVLYVRLLRGDRHPTVGRARGRWLGALYLKPVGVCRRRRRRDRDLIEAWHALEVKLLREVTRGPVVWHDLPEWWSLSDADILSVRTAWVEVAAGGRVRGARHIAR